VVTNRFLHDFTVDRQSAVTSRGSTFAASSFAIGGFVR
jgi:hypothetical protein